MLIPCTLFITLTDSHERRFNLFALINQQCIKYNYVERMTTGLVAKRLPYRATQVDGSTSVA